MKNSQPAAIAIPAARAYCVYRRLFSSCGNWFSRRERGHENEQTAGPRTACLLFACGGAGTFVPAGCHYLVCAERTAEGAENRVSAAGQRRAQGPWPNTTSTPGCCRSRTCWHCNRVWPWPTSQSCSSGWKITGGNAQASGGRLGRSWSPSARKMTKCSGSLVK